MDRDRLNQGQQESKKYATVRLGAGIKGAQRTDILVACEGGGTLGPDGVPSSSDLSGYLVLPAIAHTTSSQAHTYHSLLHCFFGFTVAWFLYEQVDKRGFGAKYQGSNPSSSTSQICNLR